MCQVFAPESEREERAELVRRKEEGRQCTNMDGCRAAFPRPVRRSVGGDKEREQGQGVKSHPLGHGTGEGGGIGHWCVF